MRCIKPRLPVATGCLLLIVVGWGADIGAAGPPLDKNFKADELVTSVSVTLSVGSAGKDLEEPVALDLGLGFPLLLAPVGYDPDGIVPVGAVPQDSTAKAKVAAGKSATFSFSLEGPAGNDVLHTTPQLLAGVRVADIARIGLASPGSTNWVLDGYEITINDRSFASASGLHVAVKTIQDKARVRLADIGLKMTPLKAEQDDLEALIEAKLGTAADDKRLQQVAELLKPLDAEKARLDAQLRGRSPWYEDPKFQGAGSKQADVQSAKLSVVTANHSEADTGEFVYFCVGGHKYVLNPSGQPLTGAELSQEFELDLNSGPLAAADLRGWALGMVASGKPYGLAPDRWHPERLLVEIDGRIVYDSEENSLDRDSLGAIRLIPPAHRDADGKVVVNSPSVRETCLWEPGKNLGISSDTGEPLDLPPADDPSYPQSEPSPDSMAGGTPELPGTAPGDWGDLGPLPSGGADSSLFPGEEPPPWQLPDGAADWGPWPGAGVGPGQSGGGLAPGDDLGAWLWASLWQWLMGQGGSGLVPGTAGSAGVGPAGGANVLPEQPAPLGNDPATAGTPFQIKEDSVVISAGWKTDDEFTIKWDVSGNEAEIKNYQVQIVEVFPDQVMPFGATVLTATVPAGIHEHSAKLSIPPSASAYYLAPIVSATPSDPNSLTLHQRTGPARAIFPASLGIAGIQFNLSSMFTFSQVMQGSQGNVAAMGMNPVSFNGPPAGSGLAVWQAAKIQSHMAMLFDQAAPGWNIVARRTAKEDGLTVTLTATGVRSGKYRMLAHLGFLGTSDSTATDVTMLCKVKVPPPLVPVVPGSNPSPAPPAQEYTQKATLSDAKSAPPEPLKLIEQPIEVKLPQGITGDVEVEFTFAGGTPDPLHPPVLYGVRLIPDEGKSAFKGVSQPQPGLNLKGITLLPGTNLKTMSDTGMPDLVCDMAQGLYSEEEAGKFIVEPTPAYFIDGNNLEVVVSNRGLAATSSPFTLGLMKYGPPPKDAQAILPDKNQPSHPALDAALGKQQSAPVPWLATVDMPVVIQPMGETTIAIPLPQVEIDALGEGLSKDTYRVMVDTKGTIKEGDAAGPGERNNWSLQLHLKRAPHIESFKLRTTSLTPGEPLEFTAAVHGSKSWTLTYDYGASTQQVSIEDSKPFMNKGNAFHTMQAPWPKASVWLKYPKVKVTLTAWNADKTRKSTRSQEVSLLDFTGSFKIVEASAAYKPLVENKVGVSLKVEYECSAPFQFGSYGNRDFGSAYVRAKLLEPVKVYTLCDYPPDEKNAIIQTKNAALGSMVAEGVYCAVPRPGQAAAKPMDNFPTGILPPKGSFWLFFTIDCPKTPQAFVRKFSWGGIPLPYDPELRLELVMHTSQQEQLLPIVISVRDVPVTGEVQWPFEEKGPPHDESAYLLGGKPLGL
jgi:hypothetical protein